MDMGSMGSYQIFSTGDTPMTGGMMNKPPNVPAPFWNFYFNVTDIQTTLDRVKAEGGSLIHGPDQVPGGQWVAQCLDPQGGFFALVAPQR